LAMDFRLVMAEKVLVNDDTDTVEAADAGN
jgi:hypothetical protein